MYALLSTVGAAFCAERPPLLKYQSTGYVPDDGVLRRASMEHVLRPFHWKAVHLPVSFCMSFIYFCTTGVYEGALF